MRKSSAVLGSVLFFLFVPCVVAGLVPFLLTDRYRMPVSPHLMVVFAASILIAPGLAVLMHAFARFALEGLGTPAPVAPTARLVVGGIYRHVRNPMYLAVLSIIVGQSLLFGATSVAIYGAAVAAAFVSFVRFYEEPVLARRYGAEYQAYRRAVPGWLPRLTPWRPL
ncbi:isoprenylcysteine carboxylmethyltransferase family protein [Mesorhizobium sp. CN2-181]|uniref:methyltransferase family protein n=1 Tax=Mesorhizobium yinganensis TaxID=3157707 RepID=UPI0032B783F4